MALKSSIVRFLPAAVSSLIGVDIQTAVSAAGSAITDATDLTAEVTDVGTVASSTGVQLPDAAQGKVFLVRNSGANTLTVYPHSAAGTINGGSAGAGVSVATTEIAIFVRTTSTNWIGGVAVAF